MTSGLSFALKRIGLAACGFVVAAPMAFTSPMPTIAGAAAVVDGDTIDVHGARLRLEGIDAPEVAQSCHDARNSEWPCGRAAMKLLANLVAGQEIVCDVTGTDKYRRSLAICYASGIELNAEMVARGMARAFVKYSVRYVAQETAAAEKHVGIWQGPAEAPWDYRHHEWQTAELVAPKGCAIKGNISRHGMIYHVPWNPWYDKVKVDEGRGERWFCTEAEAIAAGWRAAEVR